MEHDPERVVKVREQCEGGFHEIVKTLDLAGFEQITAASRGRSTSPKKRKAADALPPVAEAKRFCTSSHFKPDEMPTSTDYQSDEERTPDLYSDGGTSVQLLPTPASHDLSAPGKDSDTGDEAEIERLSILRMNELRRRRPRNSSLLCCDYSLAERANALGIPGRPEYGGGHLCSKCLGLDS